MVNKKICALLVLMMMGTYTIYQNSVYAEDTTSETTEVSVIKGNKDAFEMAENLIAKKNYQESLKYLDAYISSKPKKYEAYKLRGDAYYALRRYNLAEKDYQTAIDLKTDDDKFVTGTKVLSAVVLGADKQEQLQNPELGNLYAKLMYAQKAQNKTSYESSYAKAVELNSHIYLPQPKKDEISQINCPQKYGKVFNPQGDDKFLYDAINDIENENYRDSVFKSQYLITNYPDYYLGYYLNGVALAGMEQDEDAIVAFNNALKKNPYDFESLASLGQLYYAQAEKTFSVDDAKKSTEYFRQALKLNPNCNSYYFYIGLNDLLQGKVSSAIENFDSAIKLKSNDYNSQYYKIIAQYINGDYSSVVSGAGKLLYRRVSNYNSVMYLKALAEYKQGQSDLALEDLEKIYNSTTDIYNSDVRYVSNKEKTLLGYCYYLKALILAQKGMGTKSDMAEAYSNPIIAQLAATEKMLNAYKPEFVNGKVSLEDYKKFNNAYNSAVGLLKQSNIVITPEDIDTQYDYIRTTFDDLGVTFVYKNPNYKISAIDNYVFKKYSSKLSAEDFQTLSEGVAEDEVLALRPKTNDTPVLTQQTSQEVLLGDEKTTSIAQILATQSLIPMAVPKELQIVPVAENPISQETETIVAQTPIVENSQIVEPSEKIAKVENVEEVPNVQKTVTEQPKEDVKIDVPQEVEPVVETVTTVDESSNKIKIVADEIKDSLDFTISYPKETVQSSNVQTVQNENVKPVEDVAKVDSSVEKAKESMIFKADEQQVQPNEQKPEKVASNKHNMAVTLPLFDETRPVVDAEPEKEPVVEQPKQEVKVVEKHANINSEDFGVTPVKPLPKVENPEDVVVLEPQSFLANADTQVPTSNLVSKQMENSFAGLKISDDSKKISTDDVQLQQEEPKIVLPEEQVEKVASSHSSKTVDLSDKIAKDRTNDKPFTTLPAKVETSVPVVIVPEMKTPEIKTPEVKVQEVKTPEKLEEPEQTQTVELRPAYNYGDEAEQSENTVVSDTEETTANVVENSKPQKIKKEKPVKQPKVKKEKTQKVEKEKAEKPVKVKKQKAEQLRTVEEKPVKVKPEKVKKEKPTKVSKHEKSITSIVNDALGIAPLADSEGEVTQTETPISTVKPKKEKVQKPTKEPKVKAPKPVKEKANVQKSTNYEGMKPVVVSEQKQKTSFWDKFKFGKNKAENPEQKVKVKKEKIQKEKPAKLEKEPKVKPVKEVKVKAEKIKADKPQKVVKDKAPKVKTEKAPKVEKVKTPKVKPEKQPKEKKSFNWWFKKDKSQTQNHTKESLSKIFSKSDDQVFEKNEKEKTVIKKLDKKEE